MPEMLERSAIVIASDKRKVTALAEALHASGYNVVSRGKTAELLTEKTDVPIVPVEKFLGGVGLPDVSVLPDEGQREIVSSYLKQSLKLRKDRLKSIGWPVLDLAYVNLTPPEAKKSEMGDHYYLEQDDSGKSIINGAISGRQPVLMVPEEIDETIEVLNTGGPEAIEGDQLVVDFVWWAMRDSNLRPRHYQ